MDDFAFSAQLRQAVGLTSSEETRVLALGDVSLWRRSCARVERTSEIFLSDIEQLNAATLAEINPDLILSPVVAARFDCLDVAHALVTLGYKGSYRAIARNLPDPYLIRREVAADCPGLDFDIMNMSQLAGPR